MDAPDSTNPDLASLKFCPRCGDVKPRSEFPKGRYKDGLASYCKPCANAYSRESHESDPGLRRRGKDKALTKYYGLTLKQYEKMVWDQDGLCAICGEPQRESWGRYLHLDHDHETGKVRALLCAPCNMGIGHFEDDTERMEQAIEYLKRHRA